MRTRRIGVLFAALALCDGVAAFAQEPAQTAPTQAAQPAAPPVIPGGRAATAVGRTPMYYLKDVNRTPIRFLAPGTPLRVLGREGEWYRVVYTDPKYGDEIGYVLVGNIQFQPGESLPGGRETGPISQRGFVEGRFFGFPREADNDSTRAVGDGLLREEVFIKPKRWLQLAAGADLRGNTHDQVEDKWRVDFEDRTVLRPRIAVRRLTATLTAGHLTLDLGKQFIRWGRADILNPTDRFAPRDYVNVIDNDFLPVSGVRASVRVDGETFEGVWLPQMTPSRLPLIDQRWTVVPPEAAGLTLEDHGSIFPNRSEWGARWSHAGRFEMGLSFFDGFNHLPDVQAVPNLDTLTVQLTRTYPRLRTFGAEVSVPTKFFNIKGESAYFNSPTSTKTEYVLYVIEAERQAGEWLFDGGYAGEFVTQDRSSAAPGGLFDAERGLAKSMIGRASYTVDPRRSIAIEGAVRQSGDGYYAKGEFSQTFGQHWRLTAAGVGIGGHAGDFIGQYQNNSHISLTLRFSF